MKRVCHLTSVHGRYDNRIFFKECSSLAKNNWDIHLVVADGKGDEKKNGVHIWDVGNGVGRFERFFKTTAAVYKKGLELDAEVYHFHDPELIPKGLKLKKRKKKVIYDIHEVYRLQIKIRPWINPLLKSIVAFLFGKYEDYAIRKFDGLLVPQKGMIKHFDHLNGNTKYVANSMIIDDEFDLEDKDYSNKICFHPGSLSKPRGVLNMVQCFKYLDDEKLVLAGPFVTETLFDKAKNTEGWDRVDYKGKLPFEEVKELHKEASIGLILFEDVAQCYFAYTVKLFEFMYFGEPVIMPNFGDWVEFNATYKCGINVNTNDPLEVAEKIKYLNANPDIKKELGTNGRKAVLKELNWNVDEERLLNFYDSLFAINN